jgi:hypothetical protein
MESKIVIASSIELDTSKASAQAKTFGKDVAGVRKEVQQTGEATAKAGKEVAGTGKHFAGLRDQVASLPGPLGSAARGTEGLLAGFRALIANPIGLILAAIVGALKLLYDAFTSTAAGADKMEQVFSGIGAVIDVIYDRILAFSTALSKIFSGDFAGAFEDGKKALAGFGDEIVAEFNKAADATARLQEVEDAVRELGVSRAKLNRDLAATKEILSDENASLEEKRKAIEIVREAEGRQTAQELENAKKKLEAIRLQNSLKGDPSDEKLQAEADALAAVFALEEKSASDRRALNKQSRALEKQARAEAIAKQKEEQQKLLEFQTKLTKLQQDNQLAAIKDGYEKELQALTFKIENEKAANKQAGLSKAQQKKLEAELDLAFANQKSEIDRKRQEEIAKKEIEFEKELEALKSNIRLAGITNSYEREKAQLEITYEQQLADAVERYKDNQEQFLEIKAALDAKLAIDQAKIDEAKKLEEDKKELDKEIARQEKIINAQTFDFDAQRAAVDAEQVLLEEALANKLITEEEFNAKFEGLADKRKKIREGEQQHTQTVVGAIGATLGNLSNLVGKQTALGKAFAIAQTAIDTYQSAIAAYKSMAGIPVVGPALGAIAAAAAIKSGIEAVKKITAVDVPGQGSGGGQSISAPSAPVAPAAPLAPTAQSTKIIDSGTADATRREPIAAYVVESSNRSAIDRARRLEANANFGGG